jgi:integrase
LIRVRTTVLDVTGDHPCERCGQAHKRLLFDTPKSAAGERIYPLVPAIAATLMEHRRRQDHDRELYGDAYVDHGLVFAQPDGNPLRPDWIGRRCKQLMKATGGTKAEVRVPSLKALRSTMVTNLHEAGAPLEVISKVTGHAGGEVTREFYLNISAERTRRDFDAVASRLSARPTRSIGASCLGVRVVGSMLLIQAPRTNSAF